MSETGTERTEMDPKQHAPRATPFGWKRIGTLDESMVGYTGRAGLRVFLSACMERDGKRWVHVSFSRPSRLPSWSDLLEVKRIFVGHQCEAVQVFPPASEYVNTHEFCLHLWSCLDGRVTPDFRQEGEI